MRLQKLAKFSEEQDLKLSTLYTWRAQGRFFDLFVKLGRLVFVDLDVFDEIVAQAKKKEREEVERQSILSGKRKRE